MLDKLTVSRFMFWQLQLNLVLLVICMVKKEVIATIVHHKTRAQALFSVCLILTLLFVQCKKALLDLL